MWHGRTLTANAERYLDLVRPRALADYTSIPGNLGAWVLRRQEGDVTHVSTVSVWESWNAIRQFAGAKPEEAKYYEFDREFLLELEPTVQHWELLAE
jgi:heme-degrading monooxygenase HmoA